MWLWVRRSLFPSWSFFAAPGTDWELVHRIENAQGSWSDWSATLPAPELRRGLRELFLNPYGNLWLAERDLVEQWIHAWEENSGADVQSSVFLRLRALVMEKLSAQLNSLTVFEFAVRSRSSLLIRSGRQEP